MSSNQNLFHDFYVLNVKLFILWLTNYNQYSKWSKGPKKKFQKGQRIINALNLHQNLLNSWVREDVKKIHYFRSRSYMNGALDMATFCQIFSMQSISSLVARCYVLERTPSNLQGTKANMQWSDHTFPAISLQYIPWTPFPLFWPDVMWRLRLSVGAYTDQSGEDKGKGNPGNSPFHPRAQPQNL